MHVCLDGLCQRIWPCNIHIWASRSCTFLIIVIWLIFSIFSLFLDWFILPNSKYSESYHVNDVPRVQGKVDISYLALAHRLRLCCSSWYAHFCHFCNRAKTKLVLCSNMHCTQISWMAIRMHEYWYTWMYCHECMWALANTVLRSQFTLAHGGTFSHLKFQGNRFLLGLAWSS